MKVMYSLILTIPYLVLVPHHIFDKNVLCIENVCWYVGILYFRVYESKIVMEVSETRLME